MVPNYTTDQTYRYLESPELSSQLAVELKCHFSHNTHQHLLLLKGAGKDALRRN